MTERDPSSPEGERFVFATRKSALALAQSRAFVSRLQAVQTGPARFEELHVTTSGDRFQDQRLQDIGGKGLFIKELEEALLLGSADFAVHSIKDVPAELVPELYIACIPSREDPRDALITRGGIPFEDLPRGAKVGTTSLRRAVCLKRMREDLVIEPLRGNVDTRLRKVDEGQYDAIVLALAGLRRLGLEARATTILSPEQMLPAVGQGALGVECRRDDERVEAALARIDDAQTATCVTAERALMAKVGGNCRMPIGAYAERRGDRLVLRGLVAEADGSNLREGSRDIAWPSDRADAALVGEDLGAELAGVQTLA